MVLVKPRVCFWRSYSQTKFNYVLLSVSFLAAAHIKPLQTFYVTALNFFLKIIFITLFKHFYDSGGETKTINFFLKEFSKQKYNKETSHKIPHYGSNKKCTIDKNVSLNVLPSCMEINAANKKAG